MNKEQKYGIKIQYSASKRENVQYVSMWMNPEGPSPCEMGQSQKDTYCVIPPV